MPATKAPARRKTTKKTKAAKAGWADNARQLADNIRLRVFDHVMRNNGGYMSQACSAAETLATLYSHLMHLGPGKAPRVPPPFAGVPAPGRPAQCGAAWNGQAGPKYDRFFFSPSHYALVLYTTLIEVGRMAVEGLEQFNKDGSTVEMIGAEHSPGVENTGGSLAQTISVAAGVALARKLKGETGRVWVYMTDGELQEGQTWEAFQMMAHYRLDNMAVYFDMNAQQCDGAMVDVMAVEPAAERLRAFGMRTAEVDGHDPEALAAPAAGKPDGRPLVVLCYTDPCRGLERLRDRTPKLHYLRFKSKAERKVYERAFEEMKAAHAAGERLGEGPSQVPGTKPAAKKKAVAKKKAKPTSRRRETKKSPPARKAAAKKQPAKKAATGKKKTTKTAATRRSSKR